LAQEDRPSGTNFYDNTDTVSTSANDTATYNFIVTAPSYLNVYAVVGPSKSTAVNFSVDGGTAVVESGLASTTTGNKLIYSTPQHAPLAAGTHTLLITNTQNSNFSLDRIEVVTPSTQTFDDSVTGSGVNQFNFAGTWIPCIPTDCSYGITYDYYNKSETCSDTKGDSATFSFSGSGISLYTVNGPNRGYATVSVDNSLPIMIDTYSPTTIGNQVAWVSPALAEGVTHTLTVTVTGTHIANSTDNEVAIDRVEVNP